MSELRISLSGLFESYKAWVSENPQIISDVETTVKWVSYFVAGRISNSSIVSELIYSLSNILVLFNDRIIEKSHSFAFQQENGHNLKLMLTALEYCEVFIEISTRKLWGETGRWFFIIAVQFLKCVGRFLLMRKYSEEIIRVPPIPALDRKKIADNKEYVDIEKSKDGFQENDSFSFKLKRSGRIVRKIEGSPPIHLRNWKKNNSKSTKDQNGAFILQVAETFYITKPLLHLGAIRLFGYKTWKSYALALIVDIASIRMYYNNRHLLSKQQKMELSRRCVNLMLYLVRSPFYENASQKRVNKLLIAISNTIPFTKAVCNPLMQYIPLWQDTYFYMWSS